MWASLRPPGFVACLFTGANAALIVGCDRESPSLRSTVVTVVLLHGFPETSAIWQPLREHLSEHDVIALQLPGFGCATPANWSATKEAYLEWLKRELTSLSAQHGAFDLVGHDWGGGLALAAVTEQPEGVRSWVCDIAGVFHPDYQWHDFARFMQLPDVDEEMVVNVLSEELFSSLGFPRDIGGQIASCIDSEYARCALSLYRSATQPAMVEWAKRVAVAQVRPGLVLKGEFDNYAGNLEQVTVIADQLGAMLKVIPNQGHWWMMSDPSGAATTLEAFWNSLD